LADTGDGYVLIDCGVGIEPEAIVREIERDGLDPRQIRHAVVTHGHADHSGGAAYFQRNYGAQVICSELTAPMLGNADEDAIGLTEARRNGVYPANYTFSGCRPDKVVTDGEVLKIGTLTFEIVAAPGHSRDMICIYVPEFDTLFSSDLVFEGGHIAVVNSADFSAEQLFASLERVAAYPIRSLCSGHRNPILKNGAEAVRQALDCFRSGRMPPSIV
jgi:glyoxylase-like metal-dependent hydrolase (beta-lactamase superfamily II)